MDHEKISRRLKFLIASVSLGVIILDEMKNYGGRMVNSKLILNNTGTTHIVINLHMNLLFSCYVKTWGIFHGHWIQLKSVEIFITFNWVLYFLNLASWDHNISVVTLQLDVHSKKGIEKRKGKVQNNCELQDSSDNFCCWVYHCWCCSRSHLS